MNRWIVSRHEDKALGVLLENSVKSLSEKTSQSWYEEVVPLGLQQIQKPIFLRPELRGQCNMAIGRTSELVDNLADK